MFKGCVDDFVSCTRTHLCIILILTLILIQYYTIPPFHYYIHKLYQYQVPGNNFIPAYSLFFCLRKERLLIVIFLMQSGRSILRRFVRIMEYQLLLSLGPAGRLSKASGCARRPVSFLSSMGLQS